MCVSHDVGGCLLGRGVYDVRPINEKKCVHFTLKIRLSYYIHTSITFLGGSAFTLFSALGFSIIYDHFLNTN